MKRGVNYIWKSEQSVDYLRETVDNIYSRFNIE